jgi:ABC-type multidrug transport system fused ATPase/permease subunit
MLVVWKLLTKYEKKYFFILLLFILINSFFEFFSIALLFPILNLLLNSDSSKFDWILQNNLFKKISFHGFDYLMLFLFMFIFFFFIKALFNLYYIHVQNNFIKKLRIRFPQDLIRKYFNAPYNFFFLRTSENILRNMSLAITFSSGVLALLTLISEILVAVFIVSLLLTVNISITLYLIAFFGFASFLFIMLGKNRFYFLGIKAQEYSEKLNKEILQGFGAIKDIKVSGKESYFLNKFANYNYIEAKYNYRRDFILQMPKIFVEFVVAVILVFIIFFMSKLSYSSNDIIITVSVLVLSCLRLMPSFTRIVAAVQKLQYLLPLNQILLNEINIKNSKLIISNSDNKSQIVFKKKIAFKNIVYGYNKNNLILNNLNLSIQKNDCIGIFGDSGSGKSTFNDIVVGLLEPIRGDILVDSIKLTSKNFLYWKKKISYVSQFTYFINDTIEKNIAFGFENKNINKNLIRECLIHSQMIDVVKKLPNGINTKIGERGINLSAGQLQRISIARALYRNSEFLLLDEATSALDEENENLFLDTLKNLKNKLTIVMISHKKNNFRICNKVFELNEGQLKRINIYKK